MTTGLPLQLDHPHIVPVYELGQSEEFPFFLVTKYVDGNSLAERLNLKQIGDPLAVAKLIATIAEALQHAHEQGLVHRDVTPGNILIDSQGQPHLADFGLVLREEDVGNDSGYAGTAAYMSPEQAGGEGHLVDGRSDIFSLGIVFYGPSGCGKSSLVKAGLLPQLSDDVTTIYIEATGVGTEEMLRQQLKMRFGELTNDLDLGQSMAAIFVAR
jgi:serine/threonine protein kinase